jgi:glycosyltransferase involved in cell wall biosynthesis
MNQLTIIICTWNRAASLRATLLSLQQQRNPAGIEVDVMVVDNNSTDDTAATVAALQSRWQLGTLRYAFEARQGKQFALNTGIAQSRGQLLAFTDDDILFEPDWLTHTCTALGPDGAELAGGRTLLAWPDGGQPAWYAPSMAAILGGVDLGAQRLLPPPPGYAPAGANLAARRSLFERVGLFSETHFRHMDYEFGLRCARAQVRVAYDPAMVVVAPVDPHMLSRRYFRRWSFKAGIGRSDRDQADVATLLGVPRWIYRQLLTDLLRWPLARLAGAQDRAFACELGIWRGLGTIASTWYAWLWPHKYPQWVEYYSQKKKNLY